MEQCTIGPFVLFMFNKENNYSLKNNMYGRTLYEIATKCDIVPIHQYVYDKDYCCAVIDEYDTSNAVCDDDLVISLLLLGSADVELIGTIYHPCYALIQRRPVKYSDTMLTLDHNLIEDANTIFSKISNSANWKHTIFRTFLESTRGTTYQYSFILMITALEGLIEGNAELKYRISRHVAVLIGNDEDDSNTIFSFMKKMYDKRSKYVHGSQDEITLEDCNCMRSILRRTIIKLLYCEYDKTELNSVLTSKGFGDAPIKSPFFKFTGHTSLITKSR